MNKIRIKLHIQGAIQGIGFRPFIYKIANEFNLKGWVLNNPQGVIIEIEGNKDGVNLFLDKLENEKPNNSIIYSIEKTHLDFYGYTKFEIKESENTKDKSSWILPDLATCDKCKEEIFDKKNRRYLYPFTNCTNCGPRYTIIEQLPYDRINTTMKNFTMCKKCQQEYENPEDRRFHAQPNACPDCGPWTEFWSNDKKFISNKLDSIQNACDEILNGKIVAVKGLGGFHLFADARNNGVVSNLRKRKLRDEKPFAIMCPDLEIIKNICDINIFEEQFLTSYSSPIVLLKKKNQTIISENISTNNAYFGVLLPYTPLHLIMMNYLKIPVIATSGNFSDEPICIDNDEAFERLKNIADYFLIHNRPIIRPVDDSIGMIINNREMILRRSRGYAPLPLTTNLELDNILAVGGHLKNTIAISKKNNIFISQHIGDLDTIENYHLFEKTINDLKNIYEIKPKIVLSDLHPDYKSTSYAENLNIPIKKVQHHYAHILSCMAENEIKPPVLGVSWDGTGYGTDGNIWGSEFLCVNENNFSRKAHFRYFALPGGEKAIKEPRRTALSILYEIYSNSIFENEHLPPMKEFIKSEFQILIKSINQKINSPLCCSVGRIFDAVASILGICQINNFEGQAAMALENLAWKEDKNLEFYNFDLFDEENKIIIDYKKLFSEIIFDFEKNISNEIISAKFHNTLTEIILSLSKTFKLDKIVLSGGVFQNKFLLERTIDKLMKNRLNVYWHQRIPTNDGGISLGQIIASKYL